MLFESQGGGKVALEAAKIDPKTCSIKKDRKTQKKYQKNRLVQSLSCTLVTKSDQKRAKRRPKWSLGGHFGSFVLEKGVFQKPLFYLSKSMLFEYRGGQNPAKSHPKGDKQLEKNTIETNLEKNTKKGGQSAHAHLQHGVEGGKSIDIARSRVPGEDQRSSKYNNQ